MKKSYSSPAVRDYGSIAENTFCTPACQRGNPAGMGTKSTNTSYALDNFGEYSHPATTGS